MLAICPAVWRRSALAGLLVVFTMLVSNAGGLRGDSPGPPARKTKLRGLAGVVEVFFDSHGVPHIFADSWGDAYRTLGYLHATDRLGQMDLYRRQASGTMAEVRGKQALSDDILVRRLGIRRSCEALWRSGDLPVGLKEELEAYADGVNQRIAQLRDDDLPLVFKALGYKPAPWTPVDTLVFSKYMGWDQSGTDDDLWFGMVAEKLGAATFEQLWPLDRPYEIPTIAAQSDRTEAHPCAGADHPRRIGRYASAIRALSWKRWLGRARALAATTGPWTGPRPPRASRSCAAIRISAFGSRLSGTPVICRSKERASPA